MKKSTKNGTLYDFGGRKIYSTMFIKKVVVNTILTRQAADSLKKVSDDLIKQGYRLKIFDMQLEKEVDMGCTYDYFGVASHPDVLPGQEIGAYKPINQQQYDNRMILQRTMMAHGFKPYDCEWWHFTLANEPFPDTYFTFPIARSSLNE